MRNLDLRKSIRVLALIGLFVLSYGAVNAQPYCTPAYSTGCTDGDMITNFSLNTITDAIVCTTPSYQDHTNLSTNLTIGNTYVLTLTAGFSSTYFMVWIDYNNNYVFDATEIVLSDVCSSAATPYTFNLTIPLTASPTTTRLRIRTNYASAVPSDPCSSLTYGNAIDYTVSLMPLANNDIAVIGVSPTTICSGATNFSAVVKNFGGNTVNNFLLNWTLDGVAQPQISYTTPILTGASANVLLGNINFVNNTYNIVITASLPNGVVDPNQTNNVLSLLPFYLSLNGSYTVGPTGNFANFTAAVAALTTYGVCGPVVFNVQPGVYTQRVVLGVIPGVSDVNTVTFKSASGVNTDVVLQYAATTTTDNAVVYLNGADYYSFQDMTIKSLGSTYTRVVSLQNGAMHNSFIGNILQAPTAASTSNYNAVVVNESGIGDSANVFHNNDVLNGSYGFYMYGGSTSSFEENNVITHNNILNFYYYGVYLYYQYGTVLEYNKIQSGSYSTHYGVYTYYLRGPFRFVGNQISMSATSTNYCMYVYYCDGFPGTGLVANNFISQSVGTGTTYGMYVYYSSNVNIYNNSINITAGNVTSTAIYMNQATAGGYGNIELVNNSLVNTGGGYAINILDAAMTAGMISYQDYNNYYSTNASPILFGVWTVNNLADLNLIEPHSIMVNPAYASWSDLHSYSPFLVDAGKPLTLVSLDIDMQARDPLTPNIGADEYTLYTNDAGMSAFVGLGSVCPGVASVSATVNNYGLTALTQVTLNWSINSVVQTPVVYSTSIAVGGNATVLLGNYTFLSGLTYDIVGWTTLPNGVADPSTSNDTTMILGAQTAAAGIFTVGTGGDFATILDAQTFIENNGICGSVVFNILPGIYNEQMKLNPVLGSSSANTITWQSSTGNKADVTVQYAAAGTGDNYVLGFYGTDYTTVQNITIKSTTTTTYGRVVIFQNSSNYNQVLNSNIQSIITTSSNSAAVYSYSDSKDEYNIIEGNTISGAYYGIYWYGLSTNLETGNEFNNNEVVDFYYYGIYPTYQYAITIDGNYIAQGASGSTTCYPLYVYYCDGPIVVTNNTLYDNAGATYYGLRIYYCDAIAAAPGLVANNMVSCIGNTGTQYGLYVYYSTNQKIYHNSVYLANGSTNYGAYLYLSTAYGPYDFKNNSIVNAGTGGYCLYGVSTGLNLLTSDHNNLFSSSTTLCSFSTTYANIAAWQALYPGDVVSTNGGYLSPSNLHSNSLLLDGAGTPVAQVTTDIDGDLRSLTTPDIGADEYVLANDDAGISGIPGVNALCPGASSITATLSNYGLVALTTVTINWQVNGVTQTPYIWTGSILPGGLVNVVIGTYSLLSTGTYDFTVWTSLPNGNNDPNTSNDSYSVSGVAPAISGNYTIGATGDFTTFADAVSYMVSHGVCGPVVFDVQSGTYTGQVTIPAIVGTSAVNTVTFKSATGLNTDVTVQYAGIGTTDNWVWAFTGGDYITVQDMTIKSTTASTYGRVVVFNGNSNYNILSNCKVESIVTTSSNAAGVYSYTDGKDQYNTLINNQISGAYYGIYWYGTSTDREVGNQFINNSITMYYYYGVYLYYNNNVKFNGNTVLQNPAGSTTNYPVTVYYADGPIEVTKNVIHDNAGATFYGLRVGYAVGTALAPGLIANNMISSVSNTSTQYGLYVYYCNHIRIYYNSVRIANGATNYAAYLYIPSTLYGPYDFKNNSIVNLGTLGYSLYGISGGISMLNSSNNNLFTNSATLCSFTTAYTTMSAWQALYPGDVLNTDGDYISASDLHTFSSYLNGGGTPVPQVTTDIDGQPRNPSFPDVGADEFDLLLPANELTVEIVYTLGQLPIGAGDNHVVSAIVRNLGANTQYNVPVTLSITGANTFSNVVTIDSLTFAGVETISFSPFTATTLGVNTVTVSVPPDMLNTNNSAMYTQQVTANQMAYADLSPMAVNLGFNAASGLLLCKYHINGLKVISAVGAYIVGTSSIGQTVYGVVLDSTGVVVAQSAPVVITAIDSIYIFPILNPSNTTINNGHVYVGIAQPVGTVGFYPMGVQAETPARSNAYYTAGINGGSLTENTNFGRFTAGAIVSDPSPFDAACVAITEPLGGCGLSLETVTIEIENNGLNNIAGGLTVSYKVNNNPVVSQVIPVSTVIPSGGSYTHTFATPVNLSVLAATSFNFKAWVSLTGDLYHLNDTAYSTLNSLFQPAAPTAVNTTVLYGSMATLGAISTDSIVWYQDSTSTAPFTGGGSITIGPLYDTAIYYAQATTNSFESNLLATTMIAGNGSTGNMFDVTAYNTITIDSFYVNTSSSGIMEVWYRQGTYVGFTSSQAGWTLLGSANVINPGTNIPAILAVGGLEIPAGSTYGIYVTFVTGSVAYTNGTGTNEIYQNNDLKIQCGTGGSYFAVTITPRVWNGTIFYTSGVIGCVSELAPVTAYVANIPANDIGVVAVNSPSSGVNLGNAEVISVQIQNWGSSPANLFQITYDITGTTSSTVTEMVITPIASGTSLTYNFNTTANLSTYGVYNICVYTQLVGDGYAINDTLCYTVINSVPSYCVSSATSTAYEEITQVTLSNLSNYSFPQGVMYTNFNLTVAPAVLTLGNSHPISITSSYAPGYTTQYGCWVKVFVDWNNDGVYIEPSETAFSSATQSSSTVTGFITVPPTASLGMHSMRVVLVETTTAASVVPCGTYSWGETEDYQIIVQPPYANDAGAISILSPSGSMLENSVQPVSAVVYNFGSATITSMNIVYTVNGLNPVTTLFTGSIPAFTSATVSLGNMVVPGGYFTLCVATALVNDAAPNNNSVCVNLYANPQYNLAMTSIEAPVEGCDLGMEAVTVTFTNLGDTVFGNLPLSFWTSNMTTAVTETYTGTVLPGAVVSYTFNTAINLAVTVQTEFEIFAWLSYAADPVLTNDTTSIVIISGISPGSPVAYNATIWGGNMATLNIVNPDSNLVYTWFDASNNQLGTGPTFETPNLFDTTIYYVNAASGSAGSIALTEFNLGGTDHIEIQNMTNSVIDATGWVVAVSDNYTNINAVNAIYWNLGVMQPGQVLSKTDLSSASNYWGNNLFWNPGTPPSFTGWGMIVDNLGNVVDFMAWGWTEAQIYAMNVTINGFPIDMTTAWVGNSMMSYPSDFITRVNYDDDVVTDWINTTVGSIGLPNPNMVVSGGSGVGCAGPLVPVTVFVQYAQYDGAVLTMTSPVSASNLGNVPITVDLYNNGLMPLSNFLVQYTVSGYTPVFGTVVGPLAPGQTISYTFPTQFNASAFGTYNICIKTLVTSDGYPANDQYCTSFANWDGNGESCSTAFPYLLINEPPVYQTTIHPYDRQWWRFTLPVAATNVDVSLCGSAFDTKLEIHSDCPQTVFATASYLGYNDNSCGTSSLVHFNTLSAGTYWAKVYGYQAAFGDYVLEITGDLADIAVVNFTVNQIQCYGSANGSITASVAPIIPGATLPLSYHWSNQSTALNLSNLAPGTYILTITDAAGIPQIESVTITQPPLLAATLVGVDAATLGGNNGSITTTVTGGVTPYSFTWSNGATTQSIASCYAGIYAVTITDFNGCSLEKTITINSPLPTGWAVTPTANSHLIIVSQNSNITLDGAAVSYGSLIGVFSNQNGTMVCSGWAYWSGMATSITAYGATPPLDNGYQAGEIFTWRVYQAALGVQYDGAACYLTGYPNQGTYATGGFSGINCINAQSIITQSISLPLGWSIWSTYLTPVNSNMTTIFTSISSYVTIVKSGSGLIYWPQYNLNTIGNLVKGQGYQIKMASAKILNVQGLLINPTVNPITVPNGWSIIGYLRTSPMNTVTVVSPIVQHIVIMKSGSGLIFWPQYNLNTIGNMVPGQGYQIKMSSAQPFTFPANSSAPTKNDVIQVVPSKYNKLNNTGHNMSLGILESAWSVAPQEGDEIGAFNAKGDLIGSTVYQNGFNALTIWGDDSQTENVTEGIAYGDLFTLKLWSQENNSEQKLVVQSWLQGNNQYGKDAISVIEKLTISGKGYDSFMLYQNRPNPFRDATEISFYLPEASFVKLTVYNTLGEKIEELVSGRYEAGKSSVTFETGNLAPGAYFYKIVGDKFTDTKVMNIQ